MNHLADEKSPYLLQHASNPVDWYAWGETAFEKARKEDKPIFLSVGYSTCHWCHVMERESFSNAEIAAILNRYFVAIKVDREERPDVDSIYMTAVQAMTGQGGWPLNAFLTPELKPFYGGTYFPPESRWGRPGFPELLERIAELWRTDRAKLMSSGDELASAIAKYSEGELGEKGQAGKLSDAVLDHAFELYRNSFDPVYGGFGGAPKFPMPINHNFLFRYFSRKNRPEALEMAVSTLKAMARGGIHDQIGGGFHRYSTDERWHIPHFEKMLYDNAQIAANYLEAFQLTGDPIFSRTARLTLDYVLRDLTDSRGGFYSAEDADSLPPELVGKVKDVGHEHRAEGAFYIWTRREILDLLGSDAGEVFCWRYGVEESGNAANDPQGEFKGKNILYEAHSVGETTAKFGKTEKDTEASLAESIQKMSSVREKRPRPHRDDKVLTAWNGLMISALAKAGAVLSDQKYIAAAQKAANFIRNELWNEKAHQLFRRWRAGERKVHAMADDYAFLVQGLLDLYEADFDFQWPQWAETLAEEQNRIFLDKDRGGFFLTGPLPETLIARMKSAMDNVEPSASSVAALNLLRLSQFTGRNDFREAAEKTLQAFSAACEERPRAVPQMLVAVDYYLSQPRQIVIVGDPRGPDTKSLLHEIYRRFIPNKMVLVLDNDGNQHRLGERLPFLRAMARIDGKATAYVCADYSCRMPTSDPAVLRNQLDDIVVAVRGR